MSEKPAYVIWSMKEARGGWFPEIAWDWQQAMGCFLKWHARDVPVVITEVAQVTITDGHVSQYVVPLPDLIVGNSDE